MSIRRSFSKISVTVSFKSAFLKTGKVDEIVIYTSNKVLGDEGVDWFKEKNAIENYGFKLESSYKIGDDVKETFIKNEKK